MDSAHESGVLPGGLPYVVFGSGPPLLALPGLNGHHRAPSRREVGLEMPGLRKLGDRFTVYAAQRRPGLEPGTTMADLADDAATAVREHLGGAAAVFGMSTGGSIALQLAVDHPDLVSRLVLACAAMRLSDEGRRRQLRLAELTMEGRPRAGWAQLGDAAAATPPGRAAFAAMLWLSGGPGPSAAGDLVATIHAEDAFDVSDRLDRVTAPTLVVGGGRDRFYSPELFCSTARGIRDGHLLLYPRSSHATAASHRSAKRAVVKFLAGDERG